MSNSVDWNGIPEDVEAIVLYNYDKPSYYKKIGGVIYVKDCGDRDYKKSMIISLGDMLRLFGDRLHYRPSGPFSPSEIKFLHETTDMLHKMINTVDPKQPSIDDILQEAQQAILQHHNINGKVTFTVTVE